MVLASLRSFRNLDSHLTHLKKYNTPLNGEFGQITKKGKLSIYTALIVFSLKDIVLTQCRCCSRNFFVKVGNGS